MKREPNKNIKASTKLDYRESKSYSNMFRQEHPDTREAEDWWRDVENNLAKKKMLKKYGYIWQN